MYDIPLQRWCIFVQCVDKVKNAIGSDNNLHLGGGQYVETYSNTQSVSLTQRNVCDDGAYCTDQTLTQMQYNILLHSLDFIENALPELNIIHPCYLDDDHTTEEGRMLCKECTP